MLMGWESDPWWLFTTCSLFYTIKREYNFGLIELIRVSPRFGVMLFSMCLSIAFIVVDTLSVLSVFQSVLPTGVEPFWKVCINERQHLPKMITADSIFVTSCPSSSNVSATWSSLTISRPRWTACAPTGYVAWIRCRSPACPRPTRATTEIPRIRSTIPMPAVPRISSISKVPPAAAEKKWDGSVNRRHVRRKTRGRRTTTRKIPHNRPCRSQSHTTLKMTATIWMFRRVNTGLRKRESIRFRRPCIWKRFTGWSHLRGGRVPFLSREKNDSFWMFDDPPSIY